MVFRSAAKVGHLVRLRSPAMHVLSWMLAMIYATTHGELSKSINAWTRNTDRARNAVYAYFQFRRDSILRKLNKRQATLSPVPIIAPSEVPDLVRASFHSYKETVTNAYRSVHAAMWDNPRKCTLDVTVFCSVQI